MIKMYNSYIYIRLCKAIICDINSANDSMTKNRRFIHVNVKEMLDIIHVL